MKKNILIHSTRIHGDFDGKEYTSGRLYLGVYPEGAQVPNYTFIVKCPANVATDIKAYVGKPVKLYYDQFKNVVGFDVG